MEEGDHKKPYNLRTILLALPKHVTKKYKFPVYIPGSVESGVRPGAIKGEFQDNWRINQLSQPNQRKKTEKYVFVPEEGVGTGISASTLAGQGTSRSEDLSRPIMRKLLENKKEFSFLGNPFLKNMDKTLKQSWNSVYNFYKKQLAELRKKRRAKKLAAKRSESAKGKGGKDAKGRLVGKPKTEKEIKEEKEKRIAERCLMLSTPKKIPPPSPLPPRKIADLAAIQERMIQLSEPRFLTKKYLRPSIDSTYVDPNRVPDSAKTYEITERVIELAKCPAHRLVKEPVFKPGAVKRSALTCKVSPRFLELAVPKKKAAEKDNDLKENPFTISPNALKYVATARIQELAKPIER